MSDDNHPVQPVRASYCLFQDPWWLNLTTEGHWDEAVIANNEGVIGRMPYRTLRRYGATVLTQPRLTPYAGPWFRPSTAKSSNQFSERRKLTMELLSKLPKFDLFSQNLWPEIPDWLPFYWAGYSQQTTYTNWHRNLTDTDAIWRGFLDGTRWEIRKAQKRVTIVVSDDVERLCTMHEQTFVNQGLRPPRERKFLRAVVEGAMSAGRGRIVFATDEEGNPHAATFLVFDDRSAHYLIGGSDARFRASGAASLLVWDAIQFAARNSRLFDFEGSTVEGISRFFRGFNPEMVAVSHIHRTSRRGAIGASFYNAAAALFGRPPLRL
jgi:hypothetical protein